MCRPRVRSMCPPVTALVRHQPPLTDEKCQRSVNESSGHRATDLHGPNRAFAIQPLTHMHQRFVHVWKSAGDGRLSAAMRSGRVSSATARCRHPGLSTEASSGFGGRRARRSDDLCGRAPCVMRPERALGATWELRHTLPSCWLSEHPRSLRRPCSQRCRSVVGRGLSGVGGDRGRSSRAPGTWSCSRFAGRAGDCHPHAPR